MKHTNIICGTIFTNLISKISNMDLWPNYITTLR